MSNKLKASGLCLLAVTAVSALVVMNASAESQGTGHFTSEAATTDLDVREGLLSSVHRLELGQPGFTPIICNLASYAVPTLQSSTVTDLTVTPTYNGCLTTGGQEGTVTIKTNACTYTFTQPNKESAKTEHTVDLTCPFKSGIEIVHATCTITIPAQSVKGIGYTTINESVTPGEPAKHSITLTVNASFAVTREGGFCVLLATNATGTLSGSLTIFGTKFASGNQVGITATGAFS